MIDLKNIEYLNMITDERLKSFVKESLLLHEHQNIYDKKIEECNKVVEWLLFLLKHDKILREGVNAYFIQLLIVSAYIHNIGYEYKKDDWINIFKPRTLTSSIAEKYELEEERMDAIYQAVECQLGKDVPIKSLYPIANSPTTHFALACALAYKDK